MSKESIWFALIILTALFFLWVYECLDGSGMSGGHRIYGKVRKGSGNEYAQKMTAKKDVCKECLKTKGIVVDVTDEKQRETIVASSQKTIESKLIDLLEDLGVVFNG